MNKVEGLKPAILYDDLAECYYVWFAQIKSRVYSGFYSYNSAKKWCELMGANMEDHYLFDDYQHNRRRK